MTPCMNFESESFYKFYFRQNISVAFLSSGKPKWTESKIFKWLNDNRFVACLIFEILFKKENPSVTLDSPE